MEADPAKVQAIVNMPSPRNLKELRSLQGRIQLLRRFISQASARCQSLTQLMKKDVEFVWTRKHEEDFTNRKKVKHPCCRHPHEFRPLLLYVSTTDTSLGAVLAQHDDSGRKEKASKIIVERTQTLLDYERINLTPIEKERLPRPFLSQLGSTEAATLLSRLPRDPLGTHYSSYISL